MISLKLESLKYAKNYHHYLQVDNPVVDNLLNQYSSSMSLPLGHPVMGQSAPREGKRFQ